MRLPATFYTREDVHGISRDLLGKFLVTHIDGVTTGGMIVETEAYRGPDDPASHAWKNRYTPRTRVMYEAGGKAYIYLCYGIHHLFNVVTGKAGIPHAVLIRALTPTDHIDIMLRRRRLDRLTPKITQGPGALSAALGLHTSLTGTDLTSPLSPVWIEDRDVVIHPKDIGTAPRVGVAYAGEAASWPWRYYLRGVEYVSAQPKIIKSKMP